MPDNRNFLIAIALSLAVLLGWQFFIAGPQMQKAQQQQEIAAQQAAENAPTPGAAPAATPAGGAPVGTVSAPALTREAALARDPRVPIATTSVTGSINLVGGQIDDLRLNDYHDTVDKLSPTVALLTPAGAADAYFAEFGWVGDSSLGPLPGPTTRWNAAAGAKLSPTSPVTLTYDNGVGLVFTRTIAIDDKYMFTIKDAVANKSNNVASLSPYGRIARSVNPADANASQRLGMIAELKDQRLAEKDYKSLDSEGTVKFDKASAGWIGVNDKYWASVLVPQDGASFVAKMLHLADGTGYQADFTSDPVTLAAGGTAEAGARLFAGAKQLALLDAYRDSLHIDRLNLLVHMGKYAFVDLWFVALPVFYVIDQLYHVLGNFGLAILAVTVLVKAVFFPLANKSFKSMNAMKRVQPQMTALREQYKDDKAKQQQALMELYKKEKINPLAGCWPVAIQIPVFFSLYSVLNSTIEMRHAPFFGWIHDLSAPDPTTVFNLFGLLPFDPGQVPVIGHFLLLGIWPLLMGITMFVQMRLNPTPPDPAQAAIFTWMPVIFTFMLASFPAGLVIYYAWNNTLTIAQQYFIMRRQGGDVDLWGNILSSLGLRPPKPATAPAAIATSRPANDDKKKGKAKTGKAKG